LIQVWQTHSEIYIHGLLTIHWHTASEDSLNLAAFLFTESSWKLTIDNRIS
jgi:hypothetical protein